jgi:hypothetical protein
MLWQVIIAQYAAKRHTHGTQLRLHFNNPNHSWLLIAGLESKSLRRELSGMCVVEKVYSASMLKALVKCTLL